MLKLSQLLTKKTFYYNQSISYTTNYKIKPKFLSNTIISQITNKTISRDLVLHTEIGERLERPETVTRRERGSQERVLLPRERVAGESVVAEREGRMRECRWERWRLSPGERERWSSSLHRLRSLRLREW